MLNVSISRNFSCHSLIFVNVRRILIALISLLLSIVRYDILLFL